MQSNTQTIPAITTTHPIPVVHRHVDKRKTWNAVAEVALLKSFVQAVLMVVCFAGLVAFIGTLAEGIVSL